MLTFSPALPCAGMWYYLSLFYSEKDIGMAYSWISAGTALSQACALRACLSAAFTWLHVQSC